MHKLATGRMKGHMSLGIVRSGDYKKGSLITKPHVFGNVVNTTIPKGNVMPTGDLTKLTNPVTLPKNFGNPVTN
jgi:hypothetical protein